MDLETRNGRQSRRAVGNGTGPLPSGLARRNDPRGPGRACAHGCYRQRPLARDASRCNPHRAAIPQTVRWGSRVHALLRGARRLSLGAHTPQTGPRSRSTPLGSESLCARDLKRARQSRSAGLWSVLPDSTSSSLPASGRGGWRSRKRRRTFRSPHRTPVLGLPLGLPSEGGRPLSALECPRLAARRGRSPQLGREGVWSEFRANWTADNLLNKMKPPRCECCGRFMEVFSVGNNTRVYECCDRKRALPGRGMHKTPKRQKVKR